MRGCLCVALLATAASLATAQFTHPLAQVFNTWDPSKGEIYVNNFDHHAEEREIYREVREEEHSRKKRNADFRQQLEVLPITKACERPGYTGQYCEFPMCMQENPTIDPEQWNTDTGFYIDLRFLRNCTMTHTLFIDDMMGEVRIELEADRSITPMFLLSDSNGKVYEPDSVRKTPSMYLTTYGAGKLPAGAYLLSPSASKSDGHCVALATAHTKMTLSGGFVVDSRDRNDFPSNFARPHQFNSIILHLNELTSPGEMKAIRILGPNNEVFRPRTLDRRYKCAFEYYFDSLFCETEGDYSLQVEGVDHNGNIFRRAFPFKCLGDGTASTLIPPSTPVPSSPTSCNHGGILMNRTDGLSMFCFCQTHWVGYDCSIPICVNGGTARTSELGTVCACPIGFSGEHCETINCDFEDSDRFDTDNPMLILVIRIRSQMNDVVTQVRDAVQAAVANMQFDPEYLTRFHLVFFNNDTIHLSETYDNYNSMFVQLNRAALTKDSNGGCTDTVFSSMATSLLDLRITPKSVMYVITDALADDFDDNIEALMQFNSYYKATINFILVDPINSTCSLDVSDPGFRAFQNVANMFSGLAWHVSDRSQMYKVLYNHMNNLIYRSQLMLTGDRTECTNGLTKTFHISRQDENIIIIAHGQQVNVTLISPSGLPVVLEELVNDHGYYLMWRLRSPLHGQYIMKPVASPQAASCSFRVHQSAYSNANSAPDAFWAIATDIDKDGRFDQPAVGEENHPVFHVTGLPEYASNDRIFSALMMYASRDNVAKLVYASNGLWRNRCSYNFYFPAYPCKIPNEHLHFEFYVRDDVGYYYQRAGVMVCTNFRTTPSPPTGCQNGGVQTSNGTCLCAPHYSGANCERFNCKNGGVQNGARCQCAAGWTGAFCEYPRCQTAGPKPGYGYHVDMAFLVELTSRGVEQVRAVAPYISEIVRDVVTQHKNWIDRFIIVGYSGLSSGILVDAPANSPAKFLDTWNRIANTTYNNTDCVVRTVEGLRALLRERPFGNVNRDLPRRSIINILGTGIPDVFDGAELTREISAELLQKAAIVNVFQARQDNGAWYCDAKETDLVHLQKMANRGDGKMYSLTYAYTLPAFFMIPTLFSSSIVYKFYSEDCTSETRVHFPLDAYTQTVSAVISGNQASVDFIRFDGQPFVEDGRVEIFNDNMTSVTEFRNPCDSSWFSINQYCLQYEASAGKLSFQDATTYCANPSKAFLADDQSPRKHKLLADWAAGQKIWLGLTYRTSDRKWYFQHDGNTNTPVNGPGYWSGGVAPTDASKPCAYLDGTDGTWKADSCDAKYFPVCQKHMFGQLEGPSRVGDDDISPGKYFFNVKTKNPEADGWKGCSVTVRVQSDLNLEYGFVDGIRKDVPNAMMNIDSPTNVAIASISLGQARSAGSVMKHVMLRSDDRNSTLVEAAQFSQRVACSYEYYSQELNCQDVGPNAYTDFNLIHIAEDPSGNTFQRYTTSYCSKYYNECFNGGIYSQGACVCADFFTGPKCEQPICQNSGFLNEDGLRCNCLDGYSGKACQFLSCPAIPTPMPNFSNDGKTLVILLELTTNTATAAKQIGTNLTNIVNAAQASHSGWFPTFMVHLFDSNGKVDDPQLFDTASLAAAYITSKSQAITDAGKCNLPLFEIMNDAMKYVTYIDGAEVLLVTAAAPLTNDDANMHATMEQFGTHQPIIDYIHVESDSCPFTALAEKPADLYDFSNFLMSTGGILYRILPENAANDLQAFLASRYAAQRISFKKANNCQQGVFYVHIDANMTDVYVAVGGPAATVSITPPREDGVITPVQLASTSVQSLFQFEPPYAGMYKFQTSSAYSPCFPAVWGNGGVQVIVGFIQDTMSNDFPTPFAVYGSFNYPVFHLIDPDYSGVARGRLTSVHTVRHTLAGGDLAPYNSDLTPREGCTYGYIGSRFRCEQDNEAMRLSVSGWDTNRQLFTRMTTTWCKSFNGTTTTQSTPLTSTPISSQATVPTTNPVTQLPPTSTPVSLSTASTPPPPTTPKPITPKDIQFDIIFLVDETENDKFQDVVVAPFILNLMNIYSVDQAHARVGVITLPADAAFTMPMTFLSAINSMDALAANLNQMDDLLAYGPTEYVSTALKYSANQFATSSNGYRATIKNHLIVIVTETTSFDDDDFRLAKQQVSNIVSDAKYGLIAVGYGNNASSTQLASLIHTTGECVFMAANNETLLGDVTTSIQSKIWTSFNQTSGGYCHPIP